MGKIYGRYVGGSGSSGRCWKIWEVTHLHGADLPDRGEEGEDLRRARREEPVLREALRLHCLHPLAQVAVDRRGEVLVLIHESRELRARQLHEHSELECLCALHGALQDQHTHTTHAYDA